MPAGIKSDSIGSGSEMLLQTSFIHQPYSASRVANRRDVARGWLLTVVVNGVSTGEVILNIDEDGGQDLTY